MFLRGLIGKKMKNMDLNEISRAVNSRSVSGISSTLKIKGVSIDTRTLKPGDLFFALEGEKSDGHSFIGEAIKKRASGIVVSRIENNII